jgi:ligand-binding sensor domain-containing protein/signal transduction histidine kinase
LRGFLIRSALALALASALEVRALDPAKHLRDYNCLAWTFQNGLPVNAVSALAQSLDGYIWLGTRKGLVRFDGTAFDVLGTGPWTDLRDVNVTSLCSSREGGVWFAVERSTFAYYDVKNGWSRDQTKPAAMWGITCLAEGADGVLWAGGEYLKRQNGLAGATKIVAVQETPAAISLHADPRGRVWIGTAHGLYRLDGSKVARANTDGLNERLVFCISSDLQGNLWLGTQNGVVCLDTNLQRRAVSLPEFEVRALCVDREGAVWMGTTDGGLLRWANGQLDQLRKTDGLCDDRVLSLLQDHEGSLWVGTRNGLNQLTDVKFPLVSESQGVTAKPVLSVSPSQDGHLWLATGQGILSFDGWGHPYGGDLTPPQPYTNYTKRVFQSRTGDLYALEGNHFIVLSQGKPVARLTMTNMPVALAEDSRSMLVSVGGGLFRADRQGITPYEFHGQPPEFYWIVNLWVDQDDAIWVASANGFARIQHGEYQQWTEKEGLADNNVRWVAPDREGNVWIGTATALGRLRGGRIVNFRRQDGLPDANISAIIDDELGNLWVDAASGLFRVSKASLDAFAQKRAPRVECTRYDGPESVKPVDRLEQENSGTRTADGRIWFPRASGVLVIDPVNVPVNRLPPPVHVQSARANGQDLTPAQSRAIPPGQGSLEFRFAALTYIAATEIRFRYRLEGYDSDWIEARNRRQAAYANLKPGRYTFHVTACNADGIWNEAGDAVQVILLPHFYQTAWFFALCGLAVAAALGGVYAWRVHAQRRKEQAAAEARAFLELQVRERTAELEARRAQLEAEIEERKRIQEQLVAASREAGMAEVATSVLHNVGNVLNSVNVSADLIVDRAQRSRIDDLSRVCSLLDLHHDDLGAFLTADPKGKRIPEFLSQLSQAHQKEKARLTLEAQALKKNIEHIKQIVAMQQNYAKAGGVLEDLPISELVEQALEMNQDGFLRREITVQRDFQHTPPVRVDKHQVLQILVNLLRNADYAMNASGRPDKLLSLRIARHGGGRVELTVRDNGVGIAPENLTRIFGHGFTTKRDGHGFGLHSGALAAAEMGGSLRAVSDGPGTGATFILELPEALPNPQMDPGR